MKSPDIINCLSRRARQSRCEATPSAPPGFAQKILHQAAATHEPAVIFGPLILRSALVGAALSLVVVAITALARPNVSPPPGLFDLGPDSFTDFPF